jgi:hypothetical protein
LITLVSGRRLWETSRTTVGRRAPVTTEEDAHVPDPASLEAQIAATRAELAVTIDAIADRVSPKRVAQRGVGSMRAKVEELRDSSTGQPGPSGLGTTYRRRIRWDRVAAAGGAVLLIVWLVRRRRAS